MEDGNSTPVLESSDNNSTAVSPQVAVGEMQPPPPPLPPLLQAATELSRLSVSAVLPDRLQARLGGGLGGGGAFAGRATAAAAPLGRGARGSKHERHSPLPNVQYALAIAPRVEGRITVVPGCAAEAARADSQGVA